MLVFNLRHMHTLAWKTKAVVFSIIYSRVSWWAFSLQKQMCIEQRYACYLYRKCKSKHLEGLYSRAVKTFKCHFFFLLRSYLFTHSYPPRVYCTRWCNYPIILYSHTHTSSFHHISVSIFCMCYFILPCISTPPGPIWCPFLLSVDPTTPQPRTWSCCTYLRQ